VLIRAKKILLKKSIWVSKNAEFHADFESVEKVLRQTLFLVFTLYTADAANTILYGP
jgi:hypothetical protein